MFRRSALALALAVTVLVLTAFAPAASVKAIGPSGTASIACVGEDVAVTFGSWSSGVIDIWYAPGVTNVLLSSNIVRPYLLAPVGASGTLVVDMASSGTWSIFVGNGSIIIIDSQPITCSAPFGPAYTDGRLNNWEAYAPVAIYATADGAAFFATDQNRNGAPIFTLNAASLPAFAGSTQLVDSFTAGGLSFRVYWLDTGELQVNVGPVNGKEYVYVFNAASLALKNFYSF